MEVSTMRQQVIRQTRKAGAPSPLDLRTPGGRSLPF
jgi:hypothetical protein